MGRLVPELVHPFVFRVAPPWDIKVLEVRRRPDHLCVLRMDVFGFIVLIVAAFHVHRIMIVQPGLLMVQVRLNHFPVVLVVAISARNMMPLISFVQEWISIGGGKVVV